MNIEGNNWEMGVRGWGRGWGGAGRDRGGRGSVNFYVRKVRGGMG